MTTRGQILFVVLLLLIVACAAILLIESRGRPERQARSEAFQHLVGGVGFGPAVDLSGCAFGFDPRLDGDCAQERGPIPGGGAFCPRHAGSVFYYPPLPPEVDAVAPPP